MGDFNFEEFWSKTANANMETNFNSLSIGRIWELAKDMHIKIIVEKMKTKFPKMKESYPDTPNFAEKYVEELFKRKGYFIDRLKPKYITKLKDYNLIDDNLEKQLVEIANNPKGMPDYFVINPKREYFFIEVKTALHGLRGEQMKWISEHNQFIVYVYLLES